MGEGDAGAPVCLVRGGREGLRVADEGVRLLESLREPIAVVCLAGQYRTGKSFFLNQLTHTKQRMQQLSSRDDGASLAAQQQQQQLNGFRVGPTTESCTRGIWLWDPQPSIRNARGEKVLFMDTEGIAATDNDESYDAKIFSLGLLLSSLFVFNTMGVIDEGAIDRLFLVSELTKHVCVSAETGGHQRAQGSAPQDSPLETDQDDISADGNNDELKDATAESRELAPHFPPFVWLLRDFMLDMQQDGAALSPNEYLEKSLELRDANSRRNEERNKIRKSIQILFERRECLTLVRPVMDELKLRCAADLPEHELRPEFVSQMEKIRDRILAVVAPKQLFGKAMDGAKLAHLAKCYTETMNSGSVPDIRAAWEYVSEATCQTALMNAMEAYDAMVAVVNQSDGAEECGETAKILSQQEFEKIHKDAQDEALVIFKGQSVEGATRAACFQKLKQHIQKERSAQIALLQRRSTEFCEQVLVRLRRQHLQQPMEDGVWEAVFFSESDEKSDSGSDTAKRSATFESTIDALEEMYEAQAQGPSKKVAFYNFLRRESVAYFQTLFQRLSTGHAAARSRWERQVSDLQHEMHTHKLEWKQELQGKETELKLLLETKAHAEEKHRMQTARLDDLQLQSDQQCLSISSLEDRKQSLQAELDALGSTHLQVEKELEKTRLTLDYKEASMQDQIEQTRELKLELTQQLDQARAAHHGEKEAWIQKVADQSAEKQELKKQLSQRDHELEQRQLDLEIKRNEIDRLSDGLQVETERNRLQGAQLHYVNEQRAELETQLAHTRSLQSRLAEDADREKARLQTRLERYQAQLGRFESDREVEDILKECVSEVVRTADNDRVRMVEEEKELLQTQLGALYLKISTLPDFYQREIFCSPDPTPDFFDVLTA